MKEINKIIGGMILGLILAIFGLSNYVEATDTTTVPEEEPAKKAVCHAKGNGEYVLIEPSSSSSHLEKHGGLKHGDKLPVNGECPSDTPETTTTTTTIPKTTTTTTTTEVPETTTTTVVEETTTTTAAPETTTTFPDDTPPVTVPSTTAAPETTTTTTVAPVVVATGIPPVPSTTAVAYVEREVTPTYTNHRSELPATGNDYTKLFLQIVVGSVLLGAALLIIASRTNPKIRLPWRND